MTNFIKTKAYPENLYYDIFGLTENDNSYTHEIGERLIELVENDKRFVELSNARNIILMRYKSKLTFDKIGEKLNLSGERIRQINNKTLRIFRNSVRKKYILFGSVPYNNAFDAIYYNDFWSLNDVRIDICIISDFSPNTLIRITKCMLRTNCGSFGEILLKFSNREELSKICNLDSESIDSIIQIFERCNINVDQFKEA